MIKGRLVLAVLGAAVLSAACAPTRITVKPEFWQDRQSRIGVALTPRPEAGAHKVGAQGLLDMAINAGMAADLKAHLQTVDVTEFDRIRDRFASELARRGMNVVVLPGYLDPSTYPARGEDAPKIENGYERDLTALRAEQKLDAVVLLQVRRYGTIRSYYGFIPISAPFGFFEAKGQMVDLRTGSLVWQTQLSEQASMVPARGEWDQPPAFPNLTAALRTAIANGSEFLWTEFFDPNAAPRPATGPSPVQSAAPAAAPAPAVVPAAAVVPAPAIVPAAAVAPAPAAPAPAVKPASGPTIRGGQWSPAEEGPYRPPGT